MLGNMKQDDVDDGNENENEMIFWYHVCQTEGMDYKTDPDG